MLVLNRFRHQIIHANTLLYLFIAAAVPPTHAANDAELAGPTTIATWHDVDMELSDHDYNLLSAAGGHLNSNRGITIMAGY